jgi:hypothetical protein
MDSLVHIVWFILIWHRPDDVISRPGFDHPIHPAHISAPDRQYGLEESGDAGFIARKACRRSIRRFWCVGHLREGLCLQGYGVMPRHGTGGLGCQAQPKRAHQCGLDAERRVAGLLHDQVSSYYGRGMIPVWSPSREWVVPTSGARVVLMFCHASR